MIDIFINTLPINKNSGGIKTFLLELLQALAERKNDVFQYHLICSEYNQDLFDYLNEYRNFVKIVVSVDNRSVFKRIYFEQFKLNKYLKRKNNCLLLNICNVAVVKCSIPQVTIIQAPLSIPALRKSLPKTYSKISLSHKFYYDALVIPSIKISKQTIAVSHFMQNYLGKLKSHVSVIHEGVNFKKFEDASDKISYLPDKYILCVGTLFPYKNVDKAIIAFSIFNKKNTEYKLVIAGKDPDGKQLDFLKGIAANHGIKEQVIFTGMIDYNSIPALYKGAALLLFLSSVETFGLPVLEAMISGVPVIASNKMSIPEVVGDGGILVEPTDAEAIAKKMDEVLNSDNLKNHLINAGKKNAQLFDWNTTAQKFEDVFVNVAKTEL